LTARVAAREVLASVVVFLVALPLCMGIAIASGVPPVMGLISGIVGGLVVGSLAGSPLQVSGPAAGLAVIVYDIVQAHGLATLAVVVFAAGLLQVAAGLMGLGRWFRAVAPAVIYAMLAGIGVIIFAGQFHVMVDDIPSSSALTNLATIPAAVLKGITPVPDSPHHLAAGIGLLTLIVLAVWNVVRPRLPAALAVIPGPLLGVGSGTLAATVMKLDVAYVTVPESLSELVSFPELGHFGVLLQPSVLGAALALAVVASAESLLSAAAVDKLQEGPRTDYDRELTAQGIGNAVLGLIGGLPVTGVIVRSSANVEAGATTRWSAVLHGLWLLVAVAALPWLLQSIPIATLAAVLVYIGYKLVKIDAIVSLWERGRSEFGIYAVTLVAIVSTNLLEGLLVGLTLSVLRLAWVASRLEVDVTKMSDGVLSVVLSGAATFVVLPKLARALENLPAEAEVHLHLEELSYVDHACFELIRDWERQREASGGRLVLEWDELTRRGEGVRLTAQPTA
jgi:MFS superfamily sulfate permease-like transporter